MGTRLTSRMFTLLAAAVLALTVGSVSSSHASTYSVDLTFSPTSAMVGTTVAFRSQGRPEGGIAGRKAQLQVDTGGGWRTVKNARYDGSGMAQGSLTSASTGTKRYRVIVRSSSGSLLAKSATKTISWRKVTWTPAISLAARSAPVGVDVPYTVSVGPAELSARKRVRVQVKGRVTWQTIDTFTLNSSGQVRSDVEGYAPGLGRYRVQLLSPSGSVLATSPIASIAWT